MTHYDKPDNMNAEVFEFMQKFEDVPELSNMTEFYFNEEVKLSNELKDAKRELMTCVKHMIGYYINLELFAETQTETDLCEIFGLLEYSGY